ncbi:TetR family transcriptional regulator [Mycolicibacterium sp. (ex Dasyatis americana)]|uniref:TetR/AcrR family transcriptional regulator n=1 Tax=Mycolicibacterium porcinum TaxID=39693 RepID=UPI0008734AF0|nr:TetR/AcrR family transcriptional regulator [Mycolicibacterium porcinum]OFB37370.1 TetR family transcriptional regulator [Mycolicibacterium sp. (ex Dasyatis americana)]TVY00850.1 TetR/AcrR family transcriptional regulator [Mycolicibacterium porcinum]
MTSSQVRHWGDDRALLNDEEARSRLLDAAERCIVARGDTQIRMGEVASDAGVARSTLYRYYSARDDLLLGLIVRRIDNAFARWVRALRRPRDAASSIRELVLKPIAAVNDDDPLNRALYSSESSVLVPVLETGTQTVTDVMAEHVAPLFKQWKADGQIYDDLNLRETMQWMSATTSFLLTADWRHRPTAAKRRFVDRYLIRALVR